MKPILITIFLPLVWLSGAPSYADVKTDAAKTLKDAKSAFDEAVNEQGGWVSTRDLIKDAETSLKKGDNKKALELAEKAKKEADRSYVQITEQKKKWSEPDYIRQ